MTVGPIETVFFDAAGTLFRVRGSVGEVYGRRALKYGFPDAGAELGRIIGESFAAAFRRREPMVFPDVERGELRQLERDWWLAVVKETFDGLAPFPRLEEFFDDVYSLFGTSEAWALEPGCRRLLEDLRRRGLRLGVISNFDSRLERVLKELDIRRWFDSVTISSLARSAKPDSRIFRQALADCRVRAESSLHVGDDWEDDYLGARAAGLTPLLYDPRGRFSDRTPRRVGSLDEVAWRVMKPSDF